ncbi:MAG: AlpA family phage regulatory protein [Rhizobiaceae bacterium]|nr:AlpA family phage regulatory protein [Rhizobiaceae bacterium]MCV0409062.1 AlpA family phage regulatory protein [Rhizobiaceae bacterium]
MSHFLKIITYNELKELVPLSRSHLWRLEKRSLFPKRIRIGERRIGWRLADIEDWVRAKEAADHGRASDVDGSTVDEL